MKVFPRNHERRMIWAKNVARKDWMPTNNSYLCEVHFASDMWQHRFDGKKKLKKDSVPTIFGFFLKKKDVTIINTSESLSSTGINDGHNNVSDNNCNNQLSNNSQDEECEKMTFKSSCTTMNLEKNVRCNLKSKCKETEATNKLYLKILLMRKKIKAQKNHIFKPHS